MFEEDKDTLVCDTLFFEKLNTSMVYMKHADENSFAENEGFVFPLKISLRLEVLEEYSSKVL